MAERIEKLDPNFAASVADDGLNWYDAEQLGIEGRAWDDTPEPFCRLPARAQASVPEVVWNLSLRSAGLCVRFRTNSRTIAARWSLREPGMSLPIMPVAGFSGMDLYGWDEQRRDWCWAGVGWPEPNLRPGERVQRNLAEKLDGQLRDYIVYLPGYNGVRSLQIGVSPETRITAPTPWAGGEKPICFYGTSIVHGGCTPRPGMAYPAILGRMLQRPTFNLGFAGSARCEIDIFRLLAELDPCAYVIDPLPNMSRQQVAERVEPGIRLLREARPDTPILLIENLIYTWRRIRSDSELREKNEALRSAYEALKSSGVTGLTYIASDPLLGHDTLATVDGVHPTDLGFTRIAEKLVQPLRSALGG